MLEKDYIKLCSVCDAILKDNKIPWHAKAVSYLHIVREHPIFLEKYESLFGEERGMPTFCKRFYRICRNFLGLAWILIKRDWLEPSAGSAKIKEADILFVSHLLNKSEIPTEEDFYFYNVPQKLQQAGIRPVVALLNHTKEKFEESPGFFLKGNIPTIIIRRHVNLLGAVKDICYLARTTLALLLYWKRASAPLEQKISLQSAIECFSPGTLWQLGLGSQIAKLVDELNIKMVVTTYEGHAWERIVYKYTKSDCKKVGCAGYQQAALFKQQHAIRRSLGSAFDPDIIFASGKASAEALKSNRENWTIGMLGSRRGRDKHSKADSSKKQHIPHCLVIPEGDHKECEILFSFSLKCAEAMPDWIFVWRLHPILLNAPFLDKFKNKHQIPQNIKISNQTLDEDLEICHVALYRGSTAIVKAAMHGLFPVYVNQPNELTIDPLYFIDECKLIVESTQEFAQFFQGRNVSEMKNQLAELAAFQTQLDSCFSELDLDDLLKSYRNFIKIKSNLHDIQRCHSN